MLLPLAAVLVGLVLLAWSADRFIFGAAATAHNLGVSPLIIGLTIVGFGTSAPELLISGFAAVEGHPDLAIGNALGSNIANIGLVLGLTILIYPLTVRSQILWREFPVMLAALFLALGLMWDNRLGRIDGIILLGGLLLVMVWTVRSGLHQRAANVRAHAATDTLGKEVAKELKPPTPLFEALGWMVAGLGILLGSSKLLVWGATALAHYFGVSDLIIGLTIVAVGTSLPELATTLAGARKNEDDIAIGNILGSNIFNTLGVLGLPGVLHPGAFERAILSRDFPVMIAMSVVLLLMAYRRGGKARLYRIEGALLLAGYVAYVVVLAKGVGL